MEGTRTGGHSVRTTRGRDALPRSWHRKEGVYVMTGPAPKPPYILALDVGTSSTRTLLFDATGTAIPNVLSQRPYKLTVTNEGEVSVVPDALVAVVEQTIEDALKMAGSLAGQIGAVAIDTFWHSLMGVD